MIFSQLANWVLSLVRTLMVQMVKAKIRFWVIYYIASVHVFFENGNVIAYVFSMGSSVIVDSICIESEYPLCSVLRKCSLSTSRVILKLYYEKLVRKSPFYSWTFFFFSIGTSLLSVLQCRGSNQCLTIARHVLYQLSLMPSPWHLFVCISKCSCCFLTVEKMKVFTSCMVVTNLE